MAVPAAVRGSGALALAAVLLAGCTGGSGGGGGGDAGRGRATDPRLPAVGRTVDTAAAGFHRLPAIPGVPTEGWRDWVQVWTGTELIVWGGERSVTDSEPGQMVSAGASFDLEEGRWRPLPPSPYPRGLYHPLAAWDGEEVIVIGSACEAEIPPTTDGSPPPCPEGPAAAAYDPARARWRRLPPPPLPVHPASGERVIFDGAAGGGDGTAVFGLVFPSGGLAWDRADGAWVDVGAPEIAVASDRISRMCADPVTGAVVANGEEYGNPAVPIQVLAPNATAWGPPVQLEIAGDDWPSCGDGRIANHLRRWGKPGVTSVADLASGEIEELEDPSDGFRTTWLLGPWLMSRETGTRTEDQFEERLEVRLAAGGPWQTVAADGELGSNGWFGQAGPVTYLPDIGAVSADAGDSRLLLWRAPEDLLP